MVASQRRTRRRSLVVLLTDLNAAALEEGLMAVLPQLSAKHHVLIAAVSDPRVDAAGGRALRRRRRCTTRRPPSGPATTGAPSPRGCAAAGVDVVDAPPEELAPALADRYLAMKATGRL